MATRRRFVGRRTRLPMRWTANLVNNTAIAVSTQAGVQVVIPADYQISSTLSPKGPTLLRIRGRFTFIPTMTSGVIGQLFVGIVPADGAFSPTSGTLAPNSASNVVNERFLWWDHILCSGEGATPPGHLGITREIDIKSRVKLSDTEVSLIVITDGTMAGFWGANLRALLRG